MYPIPSDKNSSQSKCSEPDQNVILRSLPREECACLREQSETVKLEPKQSLHSLENPSEYVYFPYSGLISLLTIERDGSAVQTAMIGREGVAGSTAVLGLVETDVQAIVQIRGQAMRVPTSYFSQCYRECPNLNTLVNRHFGLLLLQAQQYALCNVAHSIESRFCRLLLEASDRVDSNVVELTQGTCSNALGVQRTSVSMVAHSLQLVGDIRTRRGRIEILDRAKLESKSCGCYALIAQASRPKRLETVHPSQKATEVLVGA
jgi:CRP-like cAMP-binding protein